MGPGEPHTTDKLPEEYAALGDRVQVMVEVVELVDRVRAANDKLGDALVSAGLPARDWLSPHCDLPLLSDQLPDATLDALITRLAEFTAGTGPTWLRGGLAEIERFNEEASILDEVVRALRLVAQRQRMLPARQRGDLAMLRALGDGRVGTQLDRMSAALRDLESLAPYIAPLDPNAWTRPPLAPEPKPGPAAPVASGFASAFAPPAAPASAPAPASATSLTPHVVRAMPAPTDPAVHKSLGIRQKNLSRGVRQKNLSRRLTAAVAGVATQARAVGERLEPQKWMVVAVTAVVLAAATGVVGLLVREQATQSPSYLTVTPASLTLTCAGNGATASLTVHDTGSADLAWSVQPAAALTLSATGGTLKHGASFTFRVQAHSSHSARGTLTFTSMLGNAPVAYTVTCG
jgi:hypothetical protein